MKIVTNHNRRLILDASELTDKEAKEFDYLDWDKLREGTDSASFFRYHHQVYDLGEFQRITQSTLNHNNLGHWDGYLSDSFFSGIVVKYVKDDIGDYMVVVGTYYA